MEYYKTKNDTIVTVDYECALVESPREWDSTTTFLTWENGYNSPDDNPYDDIEDFLNEFQVEYTGNSTKDIPKLIENAFNEGYILRPVYKYEHSEVSYSIRPFCDPWDSGMAGFIFMPKDEIVQIWGDKEITEKTIGKVEQLFEDECEVYTYWVNGYIQYFVEYDENGEVVDCCGGFIGCDPEENGISDCVELDEYLGTFDSLENCQEYLENKIDNDLDLFLEQLVS